MAPQQLNTQVCVWLPWSAASTTLAELSKALACLRVSSHVQLLRRFARCSLTQLTWLPSNAATQFTVRTMSFSPARLRHPMLVMTLSSLCTQRAGLRKRTTFQVQCDIKLMRCSSTKPRTRHQASVPSGPTCRTRCTWQAHVRPSSTCSSARISAALTSSLAETWQAPSRRSLVRISMEPSTRKTLQRQTEMSLRCSQCPPSTWCASVTTRRSSTSPLKMPRRRAPMSRSSPERSSARCSEQVRRSQSGLPSSQLSRCCVLSGSEQPTLE
mmetsp:Transcript_80095/g.151292  ORF Transcript_80095/g.151292 Transcript_80095/m.151292 type:complete len:270 (-) Transcript_80095:68-877(-)